MHVFFGLKHHIHLFKFKIVVQKKKERLYMFYLILKNNILSIKN